MTSKSPAPPRSILVVCIRLIGDVILSTPLLGLLKSAWPEARIDMLVGRGTGEFIEKDPRVRRVLYADTGESGGEGGTRGNTYLRAIFRQYDLSVNLNASDRGNIASALAGRRTRVGFYSGVNWWKDGWKKILLTHPVRFPYAIHVARVGQLAAEALGLSVPRLEARVFWDRDDEETVEALLRSRGVSRPYFVVHPFARWKYKFWKTERFAETSDLVTERRGLQPVWTSSPDPGEVGLLQETATLCRRPPALLAGALSLNQMACLLAGSSLYVGLDTAVSHIAATTGVPMVVLYGPTIAERWSPWRNDGPVAQQCPLPRGTQRVGKMVLIQKDWKCVPCGRAGCDGKGGESPCLAAIGTAEVLEAVDEVLAAEVANPRETTGEGR